MDAGKPQKQALAIAYSMKRKGPKKMAHGGEVENEKLHPGHGEDGGEPDEGDMEGMAGADEMAPDESMSIKIPMHDMVKHIIAKRLSMGGEVEADDARPEGGDSIDNEGEEIHPDNDFLSDEEQTQYAGEDDSPKSKRRSLLDSIMMKR